MWFSVYARRWQGEKERRTVRERERERDGDGDVDVDVAGDTDDVKGVNKDAKRDADVVLDADAGLEYFRLRNRLSQTRHTQI